jgi:quercetin dioxygenase-like cupin family protein
MKPMRGSDFKSVENLNPGTLFRQVILANSDMAYDLGGIVGILPSGMEGQLHYHAKRESVLIIISGEAVEYVDGKEVSLSSGDMVCILPGEKHAMINRSNKDVYYVEFFTYPPVEADFVAATRSKNPVFL